LVSPEALQAEESARVAQEAEELPEAPRAWFLRPPLGRLVGPMDREILEAWIMDGRAPSGSVVAYGGGGSWRPIEVEFAAVFRRLSAVYQMPYAPRKAPLSGMPAVGILDAISCQRDELPLAVRQLHDAVHSRIEKECSRSVLGVQLLGTKSIHFPEIVSLAEEDRLYRLMPTTLLVAAFRWVEQEFYLVVPWGPLGQMPHERRAGETAFEDGLWLDLSWIASSPLALAARSAHLPLADGGSWSWISTDGDFEMVLVWGLQCVPLGLGRTLHMAQTGIQGALRRSFGVDWYLERQQGFVRFQNLLNLPSEGHEPHFLLSSATAMLLNELMEA
jgi:hypothetical protein